MADPLPQWSCNVDVKITGTVVDILTSTGDASHRLTDATITLVGNPPQNVPVVTQDRPNGPIRVSKGEVDMWFRFVDPTIRPIGIAFMSDLAGMPDPAKCANHNMPCDTVRLCDGPSGGYSTPGGATIRVANRFKRLGSDRSPKYSWKFYLLFQTQTGAVGIIDPDVENDY